jgi:hypothetical protein
MPRAKLLKTVLAATVMLVAVVSTLAAQDKNDKSDKNDDSFDVRSSVGDMHLGKDADARAAGFALYPGARVRHEEKNDPINFGIFMAAFGFKIVAVKYESDDAPDKVIAFYREKLKKYGKVLECHNAKDKDEGATVDDDEKSKELKCSGDNTGPVTELKVGTQNNQHVVAVEAPEGHGGSTFALVYVRARGKEGDI